MKLKYLIIGIVVCLVASSLAYAQPQLSEENKKIAKEIAEVHEQLRRDLDIFQEYVESLPAGREKDKLNQRLGDFRDKINSLPVFTTARGEIDLSATFAEQTRKIDEYTKIAKVGIPPYADPDVRRYVKDIRTLFTTSGTYKYEFPVYYTLNKMPYQYNIYQRKGVSWPARPREHIEWFSDGEDLVLGVRFKGKARGSRAGRVIYDEEMDVDAEWHVAPIEDPETDLTAVGAPEKLQIKVWGVGAKLEAADSKSHAYDDEPSDIYLQIKGPGTAGTYKITLTLTSTEGPDNRVAFIDWRVKFRSKGDSINNELQQKIKLGGTFVEREDFKDARKIERELRPHAFNPVATERSKYPFTKKQNKSYFEFREFLVERMAQKGMERVRRGDLTEARRIYNEINTEDKTFCTGRGCEKYITGLGYTIIRFQSKTAAIRVFIVNATSTREPVPGIEASLVEDSAIKGTSGNNGFAWLNAIPVGDLGRTYTLKIKDPKAAYYDTGTGSISLKPGDTKYITVTIRPKDARIAEEYTTVSGLVRVDGREPGQGITLNFTRAGAVFKQVTTKTDGAFEEQGFESGDYSVVVDSPDKYEVSGDPAFTIGIELTKFIVIPLRVKEDLRKGNVQVTVIDDANAQRIDGASVLIQDPNTYAVVKRDNTNNEGEVALTDITKGRYLLNITKTDYQDYLEPVWIRDWEDLILTVKLEPVSRLVGKIEGTVRLAADGPCVECKVYYEKIETTTTALTFADFKETNFRGDFVIENLEPGTYALNISNVPDHVDYINYDYQVRANEVTRADITLTAAAGITGTITLYDGSRYNPSAHKGQFTYAEATATPIYSTVTVNIDGTYSIPTVEVGKRYRLNISGVEGYAAYETFVTVPAEGKVENIQLSRTAAIKGTILKPDGSQYDAAADVKYVKPISGARGQVTYDRTKKEYKIDVDETGGYTIIVEGISGMGRYEKSVPAAVGKVVRQDIRLEKEGVKVITGRVTLPKVSGVTEARFAVGANVYCRKRVDGSACAGSPITVKDDGFYRFSGLEAAEYDLTANITSDEIRYQATREADLSTQDIVTLHLELKPTETLAKTAIDKLIGYYNRIADAERKLTQYSNNLVVYRSDGRLKKELDKITDSNKKDAQRQKYVQMAKIIKDGLKIAEELPELIKSAESLSKEYDQMRSSIALAKYSKLVDNIEGIVKDGGSLDTFIEANKPIYNPKIK